MWQKIVKVEETIADTMFFYLPDGRNIDNFILVVEQMKGKGQTIAPLLRRLELYKKDKDAFFTEHFPNLEKRYKKTSRSDMKRKLDLLLSKFGTKVSDKSTLELIKLGEEAEKTKDVDKIKEFLDKASKKPKLLENYPKIRLMVTRLSAIAKSVRVYFTEGTPNDKLLEAFAEFTDGTFVKSPNFKITSEKVPEKLTLQRHANLFGTYPTIFYPEIRNASDWITMWNALFYETDEKGKKTKTFEPNLASFIKTYKPKVVDGGTSKKIEARLEDKKYIVNKFDATVLKNYLTALNSVEGSIRQYIPKEVEFSDGSTRIIRAMKGMVFPSKKGNVVRRNPFYAIISDGAIDGPNWFSLLLDRTKATKLLSPKQIENIVINDIIFALNKNEKTTTLFKIPIPSDFKDSKTIQNITTFTPDNDVLRRYIRNTMDFDGSSLSDKASSVSEDIDVEFKQTISEDEKKFIEDALERLSESQVKRFQRRSKVELPLEIKPIQVSGVSRFSISDSTGELSAQEITRVIDRLRIPLKNDEESSAYYDNMQLSTSIERRLSSLTEFETLILSESPIPLAPLSEDITLSNLNPIQIFSLLKAMDDVLGPTAGVVSSAYDEIDKEKDEKKKMELAQKLEKRIGKLLPTYREGIFYSWESTLRTLLESRSVGTSGKRINPNLLKQLVLKDVIAEA